MQNTPNQTANQVRSKGQKLESRQVWSSTVGGGGHMKQEMVHFAQKTELTSPQVDDTVDAEGSVTKHVTPGVLIKVQ